MTNQLLTTLRLIEILSGKYASSRKLALELGISTATVKRCLASARELGADIRSFKSGQCWFYDLRNWSAIQAQTLRWIELEKSRSLF